MRDLGSKHELQERAREHQETTNERLDATREHEQELERATTDWAEQGEPSLTDTAEALNRLADELQQEALAHTDEHEQRVDEGIDTEHADVSEPTREAEAVEREASSQLEHSTTHDYEHHLHDAARERNDAATFLADTADDSETHQEGSKRDIEQLSRAAQAAADAIRRF